MELSFLTARIYMGEPGGKKMCLRSRTSEPTSLRVTSSNLDGYSATRHDSGRAETILEILHIEEIVRSAKEGKRRPFG